jgi:hypothetical protein
MINWSINDIKFPLTLTRSPIGGEGINKILDNGAPLGEGKNKKIALSFTLS